MMATSYDFECDFCGWATSDDPEWFTDRQPDSYGNGPGIHAHTLCEFCMRSYTVRSWLAGLPADQANFNVARDMLGAMNLLRWTILGKPLPIELD